MIYTNLTVKAMKLAYRLHHGQVDKTGVPYIYHPIHLAEQMPDEATTCVALLHDTLEDTSLTEEALREEFPPHIADAVCLMTHNPEEDYFLYVERISTNPIARTVKLVDLYHNSDTTRLLNADNEAARTRRLKYARAIEILTTKE